MIKNTINLVNVNFKLFLFFFGLFSFQIIFSQFYNYTQSNISNNYIILGYSLSLVLGSLLNLSKKYSRVSESTILLINVLFYFAAFSLLNFNLSYFNILVLILSLLPAGMLLSQYFSANSYRVISLVSAISIFAFLIFSKLIYSLANAKLVFFIIVCNLLCWFWNTKKNVKPILFIIFILFTADGLGKALFDYTPYVTKGRPLFTGYQKTEPTRKNISIFSDIYTNKNSIPFIITNGSRYSRIVGPGVLPEANIPRFDAPYKIKKIEKVLIIGPGGGQQVSKALHYGVRDIYAVDINKEVFELADRYNLSGRFYNNPAIKKVATDGRFFLQQSNEKFDLIVLQGVQSGSFNSFYNSALLETYLFTEESILQMYEHLSADGIIFIEDQQAWFAAETQIKSSIVSSVTKIAHKNFGPDYYSSFSALAENAVLENPQSYREFIIISKQPHGDFSKKILEAFPDAQIKPESFLDRSDTIVTDDRPYYLIQSLDVSSVYIFIVFVLLCTLFAFWKAKPSKAEFGLFTNGINVAALYSIIIAYATITIGNSNLASVAFYSGMCVSCFLIYFITNDPKKIHIAALPVLLTILVFSLFRFSIIKFNISLEWDALRILLSVLICAALFFISDFLYLKLFESSSDISDRKKMFFYGKLGFLFGIPICALLKMTMGLQTIVILSVFITFISILNLRKLSAI